VLLKYDILFFKKIKIFEVTNKVLFDCAKVETAEDLFHACDLDSDGFIDREELKYAISKRLGKVC
jgi:hypothetical protein